MSQLRHLSQTVNRTLAAPPRIPRSTATHLVRRGRHWSGYYAGAVDSVGPKISKVKPGDRVVCSFRIACGSCM
ncbi:hypothetical protein CONLIGDRAFT_504025 [Coniochaeta ligniaria NRRL 30616]|uniref:Uncharacterized protein n=1 Tax=Coniochaeta ligniaria NRRL 30616 TaxID=1408157 RepID=A0A1J7IER5_9PEZI|nr:hypothetical protein CONLIGDRAFT_504025 [Coniochaeta ligniaria NRRL 30616]